MAKTLYNSKFITLTKDDEGIELELGISDSPLRSESELDMDCILYTPDEDEAILNLIGRVELEKKMEWGEPSFEIEKGKINCAYVLKYRMHVDHDTPEVATYPQGKGKEIFWTMMFESMTKDIPCTLELYVFFRDTMGDIQRLHPLDHEIPICIPHESSRGTYCTLRVARKDRKALDCGRYYFAFRLRQKDGTYIGQPKVLYINIVPAKGYSVQIESDMVGMDAIYRQMAMLTKQKMFNDNRQAMNLQPTPINQIGRAHV